MSVLDPALCEMPSLLTGTGNLLFREPDTGLDVDAGNFNLVDWNEEAETFRYFHPSDDSPRPVAVTSAVRLSCTGDSFSVQQLERVMNDQRVWVASGVQIPLRTVRESPVYRVTFRKTLPRCRPGDVCQTLEVVFWRAYVDTGYTISFNPDTVTTFPFTVVALPDYAHHPSNPFGYVLVTCPVGGS